MRVSSAYNFVALNPRISHLGCNVLVGQAHDQTVFRGVVLVLYLNHQSLACIVIGLSLSAPLELHLEPFEVLLVFHNFDERLNRKEPYLDQATFLRLKRENNNRKFNLKKRI